MVTTILKRSLQNFVNFFLANIYSVLHNAILYPIPLETIVCYPDINGQEFLRLSNMFKRGPRHWYTINKNKPSWSMAIPASSPFSSFV